MYWLITAYDVLGDLEIRARCVDDEGEDHGLVPSFARHSTIPLHRSYGSDRADVLKEIADELSNMAYRDE